MGETGNRIWQPRVEPTDDPVPLPSQSNAAQLYTKTSLIATRDSQSTSFNRAVLSASQSYNSSPRPFNRQQLQTSTSIRDLPSVSLANQSSWPRQQAQQVNDTDRQAEACTQVKVNELGPQQARQQVETMSPKLVHKQYNSPLDLYSMNNIRQMIEAHTESIAPGVKGINFKKSDAPVNKQSEVYRLVKEEEEQRNQRLSSCLSPISGQPLKLPAALQTSIAADHHEQHSRVACREQPAASAPTGCSRADKQPPLAGGSRPICCECGQSIVGPFAKIQDRSVHPHCFNCTTCGTSLKNTGYFTIEEKLYCEIHAKQVANMMRIPFNFASSSQNLTGQAMHCGQSAAHSRVESRDQSIAATHQYRATPEQTSGSRQAEPLRPPSAFGGPATISTMFANRSQSQDLAASHQQKYTRTASVNEMVSSTEHRATDQTDVKPIQLGSMAFRQPSSQQPMLSSSSTMDRRCIRKNCDFGAEGRQPVCFNCNAPIFGPYILASDTTWCKHCGQNHFNCSTCSRSLLDVGFVKDGSNRYHCELCYEAYCAPICSKCNIKIKGDCLNALGKKWHPSCFICGHCRRQFGNSSFYMEDDVPYCENDWKVLFTAKCYACSYPIDVGDKWIKAMNRNYHSNCFRCSSCQANLEGSTFHRKGDKPYCKLHAS